MNVEPLHVNKNAEARLNCTDDEDRDVRAPFPEPPTHNSDDDTGDDENQEEAEDVVSEGDVAATDCPRGKEVSKETNDKKNDPKQGPGWIDSGPGVRCVRHCSVPPLVKSTSPRVLLFRAPAVVSELERSPRVDALSTVGGDAVSNGAP